MKYLKVFENSEDRLYTLVHRNEYTSNVNDFMTFTKSEIDVIEKMFESIVTFSDMMTIHDKCIVRKIPDEWYLVRVFHKYGVDVYYKCDQLDGLMQCLKDIQ